MTICTQILHFSHEEVSGTVHRSGLDPLVPLANIHPQEARRAPRMQLHLDATERQRASPRSSTPSTEICTLVGNSPLSVAARRELAPDGAATPKVLWSISGRATADQRYCSKVQGRNRGGDGSI